MNVERTLRELEVDHRAGGGERVNTGIAGVLKRREPLQWINGHYMRAQTVEQKAEKSQQGEVTAEKVKS